jgi:glutamine synthetase type III
MVYCECETPIFDAAHDAGCRRCGNPVNFTPANPADLRDATSAEISEEPTIVLQAMVDGGFGELSDVTVELARQELAARTVTS